MLIVARDYRKSDIRKKERRTKAMPTLQFKGRSITWNHHLSIPYHVLDEVPELD